MKKLKKKILLSLLSFAVYCQGTGFLLGISGLLAQTYVAPEDPTKREGGLNDEELIKSQEFKHEGLINRRTQELCRGNEDTCIGEKNTDKKFLGMNPGLIEAVGKAYAAVIGTVGGDFTAKTGLKEEADTPAAKDKEAEKTKSDYCKYIAVATETISTFKQQGEQKLIQNAPTAKQHFQKEQLYKAARTHKARSGTAKIQTYGWGTTTACYGYMMAAGGIVNDWKVIAKTAAAGFLTVFFKEQSGRYADQAQTVKEIADAIPGKGDCNPITQRGCYCLQPETANDPQYCLPVLRPDRPFVADKERTTCIDKNLKADPQCRCSVTKSCFNKSFFSQIGGGNFGQNFQQDVARPVEDLSTSNISSNALGQGNLNRLAANARKTLKQFKSDVDKIPNIAKKEKSQGAELALKQAGIPLNIARRIAQTPANSSSLALVKRLKSGVSERRDGLSQKAINDRKILYFGGKKQAKTYGKKANNYDFLKHLRKKKGKKKHSQKILNFAQKAQLKAQVARKSRSLFQLISRRYKVSAERRLQ